MSFIVMKFVNIKDLVKFSRKLFGTFKKSILLSLTGNYSDVLY